MTRKEHAALVKSTETKLDKLRARYRAAREVDDRPQMEQLEYAGRRMLEALESMRKAGTALQAVRGW